MGSIEGVSFDEQESRHVRIPAGVSKEKQEFLIMILSVLGVLLVGMAIFISGQSDVEIGTIDPNDPSTLGVPPEMVTP